MPGRKLKQQSKRSVLLWTSIPLGRALILRTPRMYPHSHQHQAASAGVAGGFQVVITPFGRAVAKGQAKSIAQGVQRGDPVATQQLGAVCVQAQERKEALQTARNENAELQDALEDAKVALATHPVAAMDTALQQNHRAMITELVGDGFRDKRTLRRHIADWVEQVKKAYSKGDTRKQIAVGKGIMQRLSRTLFCLCLCITITETAVVAVEPNMLTWNIPTKKSLSPLSPHSHF